MVNEQNQKECITKIVPLASEGRNKFKLIEIGTSDLLTSSILLVAVRKPNDRNKLTFVFNL